jgi:hypothetical protein
MRFQGPNDLQQALTHRHSVHSTPELNSKLDQNISMVGKRQEDCTADLIQAFFDVHLCKDKGTFEGIRFCTRRHASAYNTVGVEAACCIVYHRLIDRYVSGYRGRLPVYRHRCDEKVRYKQ